MPQDAFTLKYITQELDEALRGGKITKAVSPDKQTLILFIYTHSGTSKLEICIFPKFRRISLTKRDYKAKDVPTGFCMLLRKHLVGAKIVGLCQVPFERMVYMDLESQSEFELRTFRLYVEIMGKTSNVILTEGGKILGCMKPQYAGEGIRNLLVGAPYTPPPSQNKIAQDDLEGIRKALDKYGPERLDEAVCGIAKVTVEDMREGFGDEMSADEVYGYLNGPASPCMIERDGEITDFCARSFSRDAKNCPSMLDAQTRYYDFVLTRADTAARRSQLLAAIKPFKRKNEKRLSSLEERMLFSKDMDTMRLYGELLTANLYKIEKGDEVAEVQNYYSENAETVSIPLDKTLTPSQNAQSYYKRYLKMKRTKEKSEEFLKEERLQKEYLSSLEAEINFAKTQDDLDEVERELQEGGFVKKKKEKNPKAELFRSYSFKGFEILSGRNNIQNERLLKTLSEDDIWLHTRGGHSSHVGIRANGKEVPKDVICVAAQICAYYSGFGEGKIEIAYTKRRNVKKTKGAPLGFVTYTDYKSVPVTPDAHEEIRT